MEREDRLSALPDGVLCQILSFLPTHDAIATSLLSKRWQPLWLSVPVLDLDDVAFLRNGRPYLSFFKFAYAAVLSCSPHQPLTRFRLNSGACRRDFPYSHFKIWLNAVLQRGVEHLHIHVPRTLGSVDLPISLFSCKTLVVLKLCELSVDALGPVHLPALKTLHLCFCNLPDSQYLADFLRGCPILEDLRVSYLHLYLNSDVVEFQSMPKLVRADIYNYESEIPLNAVCNVECLRFYVEVKIDRNNGHVIFDQECFPVFSNLIHLELNFGSYIKWHWVFEMLKHCPKLQTFLLHKTWPTRLSHPEIWFCPQSVPECISSQLRKCTILDYEGKECELQFAKYIMQNSRALQTIAIHISTIGSTYNSNPPDKLEVQQELAMCPRSSATCKLLFK